MRESLGTVRLHRFTCDVDAQEVESRSKASGSIPLPEGWMHVELKLDNVSTSGDVCSTECALELVQRFVKGGSSDAAST